MLIIPSMMKAQLLLLILVTTTFALTCQEYTDHLLQLYVEDKTQFSKEVHGYLAFSGKNVDDLGLPSSCVKNSRNAYFTGELQARGEENEYVLYFGLCFSSICTTQDMNRNGAMIINTFINATAIDSSQVKFTQPALESSTTAGAIIFLILLLIVVGVGMKEGVHAMWKGCLKETGAQEQELMSKYAIQFGEDYDPTLLQIQEKENFFKRNCILAKLQEYSIPEQNNKIISFSAIRLLAIPLSLYGYLFYLCNLGSYNYFSFNKQIYQQTFTKLALTAYYIPDILFFISGFLFARKGFNLVQVEHRPWKPLTNMFFKKTSKLILFYWIFIIIYWQISPTLHAGPIWYQYQNQAAQCNSSWWRVLLLIDNWFNQGCYSFAWFIPAELQLAFINILLILLYAKNKKAGLAAMGLSLLGAWVLVLTISSPLPSSLETTLDYNAAQYFKSTYSHLPFYLLGVLNAYLAHNQTTLTLLRNMSHNKILRIIGVSIGIFLILLVAWRPQLWQQILGFELGLARTGMFAGVYLLLFWSMFGGTVRKTLLHQWASLCLGILLMGGIVVSSCYWCNFSFPYLDDIYLFETTIPNTLISVLAGGFLTVLLLPRPEKQEELLL